MLPFSKPLSDRDIIAHQMLITTEVYIVSQIGAQLLVGDGGDEKSRIPLKASNHLSRRLLEGKPKHDHADHIPHQRR